MSRRNFCVHLLATGKYLLDTEVIVSKCRPDYVLNQKAEELMYFSQRLPDVKNASGSLIGFFSRELLLLCLDAFGTFNVSFLLEEGKSCFANNDVQSPNHILQTGKKHGGMQIKKLLRILKMADAWKVNLPKVFPLSSATRIAYVNFSD